MNKYLMDRASRKMRMNGQDNMMDRRNPYGSRGGYVTSRKRRGSNRDRAMDMGNYSPERDSRYDSRYTSNMGMGNQDGHYPAQRYGEYSRPMDFEMYGYGIGGIRPMDYAPYDYNMNQNGRNDYDYHHYPYPYPNMRGMDFASMETENEWKEDLKEWCEELKKYDRFNMPKDQVIQNARQMGVAFDKYNEEEFLTTFYMVMSDYPKVANEPHTYLAMAKEWLEDEDSKLKGADKLCAYYYEVINAGEE